MRKILIMTTALTAVSAVGASAAEWETGVSGYWFLGLAVSDGRGQDGVGVLRDGEVHVNGRLTADNGLVFRARVEIESFTTGDQIDENWGSVSGPFGTIMIGGNDNVGYEQVTGRTIVYTPGARLGYADQFTLTPQGLYIAPGRIDDSLGIHYSSPSIMGFQVHGSYQPQIGVDGAADTNNPVFSGNAGTLAATGKGPELWNLAASYDGNFGDFTFGAAIQYTDIEGFAGEQIGGGANIGFAGFTVAGFYEDEFSGDEWGIGAQYKTGPWTIGGGYADADTNFGIAGTAGGKNASGWVTYTAGPGILLTGGFEWADRDGVAGSDIGGIAFLTMRF